MQVSTARHPFDVSAARRTAGSCPPYDAPRLRPGFHLGVKGDTAAPHPPFGSFRRGRGGAGTRLPMFEHISPGEISMLHNK